MSGFVLSSPLAARRPRGVAHAILGAVAGAFRAVTTRRQLLEMDERMLKDVGITRAEALREAARAPWDQGLRRPL